MKRAIGIMCRNDTQEIQQLVVDNRPVMVNVNPHGENMVERVPNDDFNDRGAVALPEGLVGPLPDNTRDPQMIDQGSPVVGGIRFTIDRRAGVRRKMVSKDPRSL